MREIVLVLKRLYESGKLTLEQIKERYTKETITPEEYKIITGEDFSA